MKINNITGPPVIGDDFFGREKEITYVWKRISAGNNIVFPSPRRVGKTSFALKLIEIAKNEGWDTVKLNLEKVKTQQEFLIAFIEELKHLSWWSTLKDKGGQLLDSLKAIKPKIAMGDISVTLEWEKSMANVYKELDGILDHNSPLLIFFDELTILLTAMVNEEDGKKDVTNFLHWLRDLRIRSGSKIRWIFCSSVGIENFTHRHGISDTLNDTHDYELKSYSKDESKEMLFLLGQSNGVAITEEIASAVVEKLDFCLPFFLQIFFEKIDVLTNVEGLSMDIGIVEKSYQALIGENHFNTWIERISSQYAENTEHAFILLKHLCQAHEGANRGNLTNTIINANTPAEKGDSIVSQLLYMLKNDGYLIEEERLYRFRSPLLRDFWFNRFVK